MIHPILPMTYLIPVYLVAGSDPSKPGPKPGLVAAFLPSRTSPVFFLLSVVQTYSTFNVF